MAFEVGLKVEVFSGVRQIVRLKDILLGAHFPAAKFLLCVVLVAGVVLVLAHQIGVDLDLVETLSFDVVDVEFILS